MGSSVLYRPVAKEVDRALSNETGSAGREDDYFTKEHEQIPDWRTYWDRKGTWWRQERLITKERRDWSIERLSSGEQPFKGLWLERADIEWLLVADGVGQHKQEPSDIPWLLNGVLSEEHERQRAALTWLVIHGPPELEREPSVGKVLVNTGLNLRGALVREGTNLKGLPLIGAQFQNADLSGVQLQGASLWRAQLQEAHLEGANLQGAGLEEAHLQRAKLGRAHLQRAELGRANLQGADLGGANLQGVGLEEAHLEGANLQGAGLEKAHLQCAKLERAQLQRAKLRKANLQGADLRGPNSKARISRGPNSREQGTWSLLCYLELYLIYRRTCWTPPWAIETTGLFLSLMSSGTA
jgi:Pentapeptide repeats (8 copies)